MNTFSATISEAADRRPAPRSVLRALGELRRGAPVLLAGPHPALDGDDVAGLVLLAAETMSPEGIADAGAVAGDGAGPVLMLMSHARATLLRTGQTGADGQAGQVTGWIASPDLASLATPPGDATSTNDAWSGARPGRAAPVPPDGPAALALLKLARLLPMAVIAACHDGAGARAASSDVLAVDPADILAHPMRASLALSIVAEAPVPLADSREARLVAFRAPDAGIEHVAIVIGDPASHDAPLVRLHSECFTGDLLGSLRCDCGDQLRGAIRMIAAEGAGVVLYLAQEGRGIGLVNKLRAYALQDGGLDTLDANLALGWDADERSFLLAATMLERLGIRRVRLLTNNPDKIAALAAFGITVAGRVAIGIASNDVNESYLRTKRLRFGHLGS